MDKTVIAFCLIAITFAFGFPQHGGGNQGGSYGNTGQPNVPQGQGGPYQPYGVPFGVNPQASGFPQPGQIPNQQPGNVPNQYPGYQHPDGQHKGGYKDHGY